MAEKKPKIIRKVCTSAGLINRHYACLDWKCKLTKRTGWFSAYERVFSA